MDRRIAALLDAIERGVLTDSTRDRLLQLETRKRELAAMRRPEAAPRIHPGLAHIYRDKVARLEAALGDEDIRQEAAEALRALIGRIVLRPGPKRGEIDAELYGELGAILRLGEANVKKPHARRCGERIGSAVLGGCGGA